VKGVILLEQTGSSLAVLKLVVVVQVLTTELEEAQGLECTCTDDLVVLSRESSAVRYLMRMETHTVTMLECMDLEQVLIYTLYCN